MTIMVARDDRRRRFTAIGKGALDAAEVLAFMSSLRVGDFRSYALLFDFTAATVEVTAEHVRLIAAHGEAVRAEDGPRGPVALVGIRPGAYELARLYQTLVDIPNLPALRVFKTREDADSWLARELAQS
jgi:hypothetical protein